MIEERKKRKAIELFLRGNNYQTIHEKLGISLGLVSELVNDFKEKHADYEQLRAIGEKLPNNLDFSQLGTLLDSIIKLQKELNCNIEDVPSLVQSKISVANEIEELKRKRDSIAGELSELDRFKHEEQQTINSLQLRHNNLVRDVKILEFQRADRQRDLVILAQALQNGQRMIGAKG